MNYHLKEQITDAISLKPFGGNDLKPDARNVGKSEFSPSFLSNSETIFVSHAWDRLTCTMHIPYVPTSNKSFLTYFEKNLFCLQYVFSFIISNTIRYNSRNTRLRRDFPRPPRERRRGHRLWGAFGAHLGNRSLRWR